MSRRNNFGYQVTKTKIVTNHEAMFDFSWRGYHLMFSDVAAAFEPGLDDDEISDENDDWSNPHNNRFCGFTQNFLLRGDESIAQEEAEENAKKLVEEEEKLRKKSEKKKQKKMRQRERRRLEKQEKENAEKAHENQINPVPVKTKAVEKESKNNNKGTNAVPPDPEPQITSVASESSDCDKDDDDDDNERKHYEAEELDMNSWFVSKAAAIAKRKQKTKPERKDIKADNLKYVLEEKETVDSHNKNSDQSEDVASEEKFIDPITQSTKLAMIGNKYAQAGKLEMAVSYFTQAIKNNPQEFKLFGNRSFCYEKMLQYEKALIDADIAVSLNPTWIKGLYRKGRALVGLKRYYEAALTYKEVLKFDSSCRDAAHELFRVNIMQLMDMGYNREQSSNALIIHGTLEKALEVLTELHCNMAPPHSPRQDSVSPELKTQPSKDLLGAVSQNQHRVITGPTPLELFPIWVGNLVPALSEPKLYELFKPFGSVYSIKVLFAKRCAFVNYTRKEDCDQAIKNMNGYHIAGTCLIVHYPDRLHTHLGASKTALTDVRVTNKLPDECSFWRTSGCIKNDRCTYRHIPENKGVDQPK